MGEEVKITVIATGFRDQMPERRARMLSVEEAPLVSVPLVSVPVVAPENWMQEPAAAHAAPRFMSQDEDEPEEIEEPGEPVFFSASAPGVAAGDSVEAPLVQADANSSTAFDPEELETESVPARPQFEEMAEELAYTPLPRDYASEFAGSPRGQEAQEEPHPQPVHSLFPETDEESQRDLDVPAFMRRLQF
jgi:cell division protein FtsZ